MDKKTKTINMPIVGMKCWCCEVWRTLLSLVWRRTFSRFRTFCTYIQLHWERRWKMKIQEWIFSEESLRSIEWWTFVIYYSVTHTEYITIEGQEVTWTPIIHLIFNIALRVHYKWCFHTLYRTWKNQITIVKIASVLFCFFNYVKGWKGILWIILWSIL